MAIELTGRKAVLRSRMKGHVKRNINEMKRWNKIVTEDMQTMSPLAVRAFASSNLRADAAAKILSDLEFQDTADSIEETIAFNLRYQMSPEGTQEALAVYLEAQQILRDEELPG